MRPCSLGRDGGKPVKRRVKRRKEDAKMKYMVVSKTPLGYRIRFDIPGKCAFEGAHYVGYSRRAAIKAALRDFGYAYKHFVLIYV